MATVSLYTKHFGKRVINQEVNLKWQIVFATFNHNKIYLKKRENVANELKIVLNIIKNFMENLIVNII